MPDDSLTGKLGESRRRKMRNLRDSSLVSGASAGAGGPIDPNDPGGPTDGPSDPGPAGPGDCGGGLMGCEELAKGPFCSPDSSGAYEEQVGCVVDVVTAELSPGDTVAWAADLKLTTGTEVNPAGTLKMTDSGLLYRDALDTLDGVTIENGTAEILNGKLHLPDGSNNDVRFTGATTRNEVVAQIRLQGSMNPSNWGLARFAGRATGSLDGYVGGYGKFQDSLSRFVGGASDAQLDTEDYPGGAQRVSGERTVCKIYTADGVQKLKMSSLSSDQTYQMSATDTDLNAQTGVPAFISIGTTQPTIAWDLIQCPNDEITCSSLPTGYSIRVGTLSATESAGTATLDLEGTLYPSPFPLEILDDNGDVVEAWMPSAGFFGGATFEYSAGGAFGPDDADGQIDLDITDASGTLIETATTGSTWGQPSYRRFSGTVQLPEGAAFLAPMMRRTGTDSAVLCSRLVVVRKGITAPWVPCADDPSGGAGEIVNRGAIILNTEFAGGAYWGVDEVETSDGSVEIDTPTLGSIDFDFSAGFGNVMVRQSASGSSDIDKSTASVAARRFYPVLPDDTVTICGFAVREDDTPTYDDDLLVYVDYWDADRNLVGGEFTTRSVFWEQTETGLEPFGGLRRRQAEFQVGYGRLNDDFFTEITEDERQSIRYLTITLEATTNANTTSIGLKWLEGWVNDRPIRVDFDLRPTNENVMRVDWRSSHIGIGFAVLSLEGEPTQAEVDIDPDDLPGGTSISTFRTVNFETYSDEFDWPFNPIPFGARVYAGVLVMADPGTFDVGFGPEPDLERMRRSSVLLTRHYDNTGQLADTTQDPAGASPDVDFAYGPRHELVLSTNCTPAFLLTQPANPGVYDTLDYDYTGTVWELIVKQDGSGGHSFTFPASNCVFAGGSQPTVSSGANAEDRFRIECVDSDETTPVFLVSVIAQNIS